MIDSAGEDLKEEETRIAIRQDVSIGMKKNSHMIRILEAHTIIVTDLTKKVTAQALGEIGLQVPGMTEEDACIGGHRIMELTVRGRIAVCDLNPKPKVCG
jgi:hypothetical protein